MSFQRPPRTKCSAKTFWGHSIPPKTSRPFFVLRLKQPHEKTTSTNLQKVHGHQEDQAEHHVNTDSLLVDTHAGNPAVTRNGNNIKTCRNAYHIAYWMYEAIESWDLCSNLLLSSLLLSCSIFKKNLPQQLHPVLSILFFCLLQQAMLHAQQNHEQADTPGLARKTKTNHLKKTNKQQKPPKNASLAPSAFPTEKRETAPRPRRSRQRWTSWRSQRCWNKPRPRPRRNGGTQTWPHVFVSPKSFQRSMFLGVLLTLFCFYTMFWHGKAKSSWFLRRKQSRLKLIHCPSPSPQLLYLKQQKLSQSLDLRCDFLEWALSMVNLSTWCILMYFVFLDTAFISNHETSTKPTQTTSMKL